MNRVQSLTAGAALAFALSLVVPSPATAGAGKCPCWSDKSLTAMVTNLVGRLGPVAACDRHPMTLSAQGRISQVAALQGPPLPESYQIEVVQELGMGAVSPPACLVQIRDVVVPRELTVGEFWRCAGEVAKLCRDLDLPPIE